MKAESWVGPSSCVQVDGTASSKALWQGGTWRRGEASGGQRSQSRVAQCKIIPSSLFLI